MSNEDKIKVLVNRINQECFFPSYFDHNKMSQLITDSVKEMLSEDAAIMDHNQDEFQSYDSSVTEARLDAERRVGRPKKQ